MELDAVVLSSCSLYITELHELDYPGYSSFSQVARSRSFMRPGRSSSTLLHTLRHAVVHLSDADMRLAISQNNGIGPMTPSLSRLTIRLTAITSTVTNKSHLAMNTTH